MTAAAKIRYRVLKKCFVNDQLYDPPNMPEPYIMAAPGLEGIALKLAPEGSMPTMPDVRDGRVIGAPGFDLSATRAAYLEKALADLEKKLAERDEEIASAEDAIADLQSKLDAERDLRQLQVKQISDRHLEATQMVSDLTEKLAAARQPQTSPQPKKDR